MKVVFMGTPDFSVPTLNALIDAGHEIVMVVTQPDRPKGRKRKLSPPPVKTAAEKHNIQVIQPQDMEEPGVRDTIKKVEPDVIVTVAIGHVLKLDILDLPKYGSINGHASLLPRHRGAAPIQAAILAGDEVTGVTTMQMDEGLDTGDVILQREVKIDPDDNCEALHDKLAEVSASLMNETLEAIISGNIKPVPQDDSKSTYAHMLKKSDGEIDWNTPAKDICLKVRAFDPWPGAFCPIYEKPTKITKAMEMGKSSDKPAGTIIKSDKDGIMISTSDKMLRILELQPPGKRRMSVRDFLAGHGLMPGDILK